jgi:hypothetical protein
MDPLHMLFSFHCISPQISQCLNFVDSLETLDARLLFPQWKFDMCGPSLTTLHSHAVKLWL